MAADAAFEPAAAVETPAAALRFRNTVRRGVAAATCRRVRRVAVAREVVRLAGLAMARRVAVAGAAAAVAAGPGAGVVVAMFAGAVEIGVSAGMTSPAGACSMDSAVSPTSVTESGLAPKTSRARVLSVASTSPTGLTSLWHPVETSKRSRAGAAAVLRLFLIGGLPENGPWESGTCAGDRVLWFSEVAPTGRTQMFLHEAATSVPAANGGARAGYRWAIGSGIPILLMRAS